MARTRQTARKATGGKCPRREMWTPTIQNTQKRFIGGKLGLFRNHVGTLPLSLSQSQHTDSTDRENDNCDEQEDIDVNPNLNQKQQQSNNKSNDNCNTNNSNNNCDVDVSLTKPWPLCHKGIWQFAYPDWIFNKELDFCQDFNEIWEAKRDCSENTGYNESGFYGSWWEKLCHGKPGDYSCKNQFEWIDSAIELLKDDTRFNFLPLCIKQTIIQYIEPNAMYFKVDIKDSCERGGPGRTITARFWFFDCENYSSNRKRKVEYKYTNNHDEMQQGKRGQDDAEWDMTEIDRDKEKKNEDDVNGNENENDDEDNDKGMDVERWTNGVWIEFARIYRNSFCDEDESEHIRYYSSLWLNIDENNQIMQHYDDELHLNTGQTRWFDLTPQFQDRNEYGIYFQQRKKKEMKMWHGLQDLMFQQEQEKEKQKEKDKEKEQDKEKEKCNDINDKERNINASKSETTDSVTRSRARSIERDRDRDIPDRHRSNSRLRSRSRSRSRSRN